MTALQKNVNIDNFKPKKTFVYHYKLLLVLLSLFLYCLFCHTCRSRLTDIKSTREGVKNSISEARTEVEERFKEIKQEIEHVLEARQRGILATIGEIERKDLDPLTNLEEKIHGELDKTVKLVEKGRDLLSCRAPVSQRFL